MNLFEGLIHNIYQNINFLNKDFLGLNVNIFVFSDFTINLLLALFFIFTSFAFGKRILPYFITITFKYSYLVNIAVGYILISTGIALLGMFSLLNNLILSVYLICIFVFSFGFPFSLKKNILELYTNLSQTILFIKQNKFVFIFTILFLFLGLINLLNLEIREDQYHVDLPRQYLKYQTIMIPPKEDLHVSGSPLLSEMYYLIGIFLGYKESTRFIHFGFYILTLLTLVEFSRVKNYKFAIYTPLLLVSAPEVIHEASSMYVDFQWIFCFLLSVLVLIQNKKITTPILAISGFLLGGMLATKLWTIVFIPVAIVYLFITFKNIPVGKKILNLLIFIFFTLIAPLIWFLRSFILTGNPLYPAFINETLLDSTKLNLPLSHYLGINYAIFNSTYYLNVFSPLFIFGIILVLYQFKTNFSLIKKLSIFKYLLILLVVYLFIVYPYGRYLLGLYVLSIFLAAFGIDKFLSKFKLFKYVTYLILLAIFVYYFVNYMLVLPYSLGLANKNSYLSRILIRDNSSYYDFGNKFNKYISDNDLVAMYNFHGYYYANFNYIDINYIFDNKIRNFKSLKEKKVNKILIRGGDMNWFCNKIKINNCKSKNYSIISSYLEYPYYYLYNIK